MARKIGAQKPEGRSAISNGSSLFLADVDGRSVIARRFRDITTDFSGLVGEPTVAQDALIRRIAALSVQCELDECAMAAGQEFDGELYIRRANILGGLIARLGLARPAKDGGNAKVIDAHTTALMGDSP